MGIPATSDNGKGSGNAGNNGNATFGSPQYDNEYTFNGESYNPNIHSHYLRARYYDTVKGSFLTEDSYLGDIRNPLTLNRYSYCIGNPLYYRDPSGHNPTQKELQEIYNYVDDKYPIDSNMSKEEQIERYSARRKETNKFVKHLSALQYLGDSNASVAYVTEYDYSPDNTEKLNTFDNVLGEAAYRGMKNNCYQPEMGSIVRIEDGWLDLYNALTVGGNGRLVSIPEDRPRRQGTYWGSPSWKSYEAVYYEGTNYVNEFAEEAVIKNWKVYPDSLGMIRATRKGEEDAIERYVIAVGPRVMVPDYPFTDGQEIAVDQMKYGTEIDVILRDSYYNIYFVPAIVGDIKEHTLDSEYADRKLNDKAGIKPESDDPKNGIYQTAVSWVDRTIPNYVRGNTDQYPNGAIVEFLRKPEESIDKELMRTPEFDILGLLVYDK